MKPSTVAALDRINRRFYDQQAEDFDQTRQGPWAGWRRVVDTVDTVRARQPAGRPLTALTALRVLDVGCGNGRFGRFLAEALPGKGIRWAGLDASGPLLESARSLESTPGLVEPIARIWHLLGPDGEGPPALPLPADLWPAAEPTGKEPDGDGYDLIVAFGVFHHVPDPLQADVLARMLDATRSGGLTVASFWQFAELPHYAGRRIPWTEAEALEWISAEDLRALDPNDWLLRWGDGEDLQARYCRATDEDAARSVVSRCSGSIRNVEWFRADGRTGALNLYALIERR